MSLLRSILIAIVAVSMIAFSAPAQTRAAAARHGNPVVVMLVEHNGKPLGKILIELYPKDAPISVANFIKLVNMKYYNGLKFHRITNINGDNTKIVQGGDNGTGGPGWSIKGEFSSNGVDNPLVHNAGAVAMARTNDPNSAGGQFYICVNPVHDLDGNYAVFGQVIQGLKVADKLQIGDKMTSVTMAK